MDIKVSIGLAVTLAMQISAAVWYVAQTDATIKDLSATVAELSSANLKRDVDVNASNITNIDGDVKSLGTHLARGIGNSNDILRRISILETDVMYMQREIYKDDR
jgi:hypothetical protein